MKQFKELGQRSLLLLIAAFFICPVSGAEDYGDTIVVGSIGDARTLVPILASDSASQDIVGLVFNGLVKYDKDINIVGDLAERWEISEDKLTITFYLRRDVRWHDGVKFSAQDVRFTFERLIDPNVRTPYSGDFERVKELIVEDDYTLKVVYKEPFSPGLSSWGMWVMPRHILEKEDLNKSAFSRNPVGTGPYVFKNWRSQAKIELISNHGYFEHRPYIDRYLYRVIPDTATIFLELQTQGVDTCNLSPLQYMRQTDTAFFKTYYRKFSLPNFGYTYMGYNLNNPKFQDKRVRQALNYAVDKKEIINIVFLGLGRVATGPFIPGSWAFNEKVSPAGFDPKKALGLLKDAGWSDTNGDGWLDRDGKRFTFTIVTNQGNEERAKVAQIIQRHLGQIGIEVRIQIVEWSVFVTEIINKRKFEAVLLGWGLSRDPDNYDIWHSSKTREGEFNFAGYKNGEVDKLLVEARMIFDQEERKGRYHRIHEILYEEQPYMFLYVPDSLVAVHKRFRGIKPALLGIGYNFIDWWVSKEQQRYRHVIQR
jgi:peptide/nickel transport system substrate-binding protein